MPMDQQWFEMRDVRRRRLDNAAWIPLRAIQRLQDIGESGHVGRIDEFFGAGSVAVPVAKRSEAEKLGWDEVGISRDHRPYVEESGVYVPSDNFGGRDGQLGGVPLVLAQRGNRDEHRQFHLHQDFVIALGLKREDDSWVAIDEGYVEIARLIRHDGVPILLEVRTEFLKDYLCARDMALYVSSYRNRLEVVEDASYITWPDNPYTERTARDRWQGSVHAIHEGGFPFGESMAFFHAARTDVDSNEDVPTMSNPPSDENTVSREWTGHSSGGNCIESMASYGVPSGLSRPRAVRAFVMILLLQQCFS
jgi:hypothetical protein